MPGITPLLMISPRILTRGAPGGMPIIPGCMGIGGIPGILGWAGGIAGGAAAEVRGTGAPGGRGADAKEGIAGGREAAAAMDWGVGAWTAGAGAGAGLAAAGVGAGRCLAAGALSSSSESSLPAGLGTGCPTLYRPA